MLTTRQIAKELINRKQNTADTSIGTSSYEMIDQVDPDTSDDVPRRHFWGLTLRKRANVHDTEDLSHGRRVVSEPLPSGLRRMAVLRRFRFVRPEHNMEEEEGDLTISTETDVSISVENEARQITPPRSRGTNRSTDSGPSFISFAPTSPSTPSPPASRLRQRERPCPSNPSPISASPITQLAPILNPPEITPNRSEAIRAITTEARFADISTNTVEESLEYPSFAETSSSFGGILRAPHDRVPNNTPVQTVRFLDSPREYLRRKALERQHDPLNDQRSTQPLPPAQITQTGRWARLGEILHLIENEDHPRSESSFTPEAPREPSTPSFLRSSRRPRYSSANSPITFARFDPPDPICSTPLPKYRFPSLSHSTDTSRSTSMPSPLSESSLSVEVSSTWSTRFADEDGIVEVCSALEALWEYGSSSEDDAHEELADEPSDDSEEKGTEYSGERRGSADLLPLKFKGYPKEVIEEPFPFASSLRF